MAGVVGTSLFVAEGWMFAGSPSAPLVARGDGRVVTVTGVVPVAIVNAGVEVVVTTVTFHPSLVTPARVYSQSRPHPNTP